MIFSHALWFTLSVELWSRLGKEGVLVLDDEQLFDITHELLLLQ